MPHRLGFFVILVLLGSVATAQVPTPRVLQSGTVGVAYDSGIIDTTGTTCSTSAGGVTSGSLPPGITCYSIVPTITGAGAGRGIRGTPTQPGTFTFTLGTPSTTAQQFRLTINQAPPGPLVINTTSLFYNASRQPQTLPVRIDTTGPPVPFGASVIRGGATQVEWLTLSPTPTGRGSTTLSGVAPTTIYATANPTELPPGRYNASINIRVSSPAAAAVRERSSGDGRQVTGDNITINVTLTVSDDRLTFYFLRNGPLPAPKVVSVNPVGAPNTPVSAFPQVNQPSGGNWLSVTPLNTTAPVNLTVSANPAGLGPGTYTGTVSVFVTNSAADSRVVGVTLIVVDGSNARQMAFNFQVGGPVPPPQDVAVSNSGATPLTYVADVSAEGGNWLSVDPVSGNLDPGGQVPTSVSVAPAGLARGVYRGLCAFADPIAPERVLLVQVTLTVTSTAQTRQVISHVADGQQWKTTIILVNLDTVPAPFTVNFWRDDGSPFPISLTGVGPRAVVEDTIPVGGSRTIESDGTGAELIGGWAEVVSSQNISGTAIFRAQNIGQEAAVPLITAENTRLLLPFDTSSDLALGVGLANASTTRDGSSTMTWRNQQGQTIANQPMPLGTHAHRAFVLANPSTQASDQRGVLEFNAANGIYALGIRSSGAAFTSIESIGPQARGTKTISHVADGARWKTTIILVNGDTIPAQFRLEFWKQDGSPMTVSLAGRGNVSSISDTIPVGGARTIETEGVAPNLSQGWAQVVTEQAIGGTAIFRATDIGQEAAVPLLAAGSARLLIPFDTGAGLALGIAIANPNPAFAVPVNVTLRNQQGQLISTNRVDVPRHGHAAFVLANPSNQPADQRGVVELTSSSGQVFALGIRSNLSAFTSIRALGN